MASARPASGSGSAGSGGGAGWWRSLRSVAAPVRRDSWRRRGSWSTTMLTGALFAVVVAGLNVTNQRLQERAERISFRVAVAGDVAGSRRLADELTTERLRLEEVVDPATEVTEARAAVGLRFPDDTDARLAQGQPVEVALFYRAGQNVSREALNTLVLRLQEIELDRLGANAIDVAPAIEVTERQVALDARVNQLQYARAMAALVALLCLAVVSSAAAVLGRSRERRVLEPLLVLPLPRRWLAAGVAAGAFPVAVLQLVAAVGLLSVVSALPVAGLDLGPPAVAQVALAGLVGAVLLGALGCATGTLAGALGTGSDDAVGLGDFLAVPFVLVGLVLFLEPSLPGSVLTYAVPILGPALVVRDGASGLLGPVDLVVAVATTAAWSAILVAMTGRRLGSERLVTRPTR